ncbi:MAG: hypothetical protein KGI97_02405 [Alphaproteobacteria bacterium]|nr:hypothetical protein [Alphaproteobacteria bacterium]
MSEFDYLPEQGAINYVEKVVKCEPGHKWTRASSETIEKIRNDRRACTETGVNLVYLSAWMPEYTRREVVEVELGHRPLHFTLMQSSFSGVAKPILHLFFLQNSQRWIHTDRLEDGANAFMLSFFDGLEFAKKWGEQPRWSYPGLYHVPLRKAHIAMEKKGISLDNL